MSPKKDIEPRRPGIMAPADGLTRIDPSPEFLQRDKTTNDRDPMGIADDPCCSMTLAALSARGRRLTLASSPRSSSTSANPPTPSSHASTDRGSSARVCSPPGSAGPMKGKPDVAIYLARRIDGERWSKPVQDHRRSPARRFGGSRAGIPVLYPPQRPARCLLFAKVGPSPAKWWGVLATSDDDGETWSKPRRLPDGILGPIKNKPIQLPDVTVPCFARRAMRTTSSAGASSWNGPPISA